MRIKQISVTNLFNTFNHLIPLNVGARMTIIHGPNGFGKTILLRMLDGLFNSNYSIFKKIPFKTFQVEFENGTNLTVEQHYGEFKEPGKIRKVFIYGPDSDCDTFNLTSIDRENLGGSSPVMDDMIPPWLKKLQESCHVRLIQTDRLLTRRSAPRYGAFSIRELFEKEMHEEDMPTVLEYSQELANTLQETLAQSVELSASLDRSFPMRLMERFRQGTSPDLTTEDILEKLSKLEEKRSRLMAAGLLDKDDDKVQIPQDVDFRELINVFSIYVEDVQKKREIFDNLLNKIELLQNIINNKRFSYKSLNISKQEGFVFTALDGQTLPLDALSSGEQHELVLLYELLFKVPPNSLILIDEPEISLHIAWQQEFLSDLLNITSIGKFDVLIATHSPDIINDRWDLTVGLEGPQA